MVIGLPQAWYLLSSNILWLAVTLLCYMCYKMREKWRPESLYWKLWILASLLFFGRGAVFWFYGDWAEVISYTLGIISAILMTSGFYALYASFFGGERKIFFYLLPLAVLIGIPFLLGLGYGAGGIGYIYRLAENLVWIISSLLIMFYVLMLAVKLKGGMVWAMFPAVIAAYCAGAWNVLAFAEIVGGIIPYGIAYVIEIFFGIAVALTFFSFYATLHEMAPPAYKILETPSEAV